MTDFASQSTDDSPLARRTLRKVTWRLMPFICTLYIFNILDRSNVGFARLTMQKDLGMEPWVYDIGIGLFYFGYLLFEVPSNLLMRRIGARLLLARIMIGWGLVSSLTMFVVGPISFSLARILLGIGEAGFFPGIILYLTYWFPQRERARMTAVFMMAIALASIVGNPLSGLIVQEMHGKADLLGWQWLFLLEGIPSIVLGFVTLAYLTDRPEQARWLEPEERDWLVRRTQGEEVERQKRHGADRLGALMRGRVLLLIAVYFTVAVGANASGAYYPTLIQKQFPEATPWQLGLLSALPHLCAAVGMNLFGLHSDRTGERRLHVAFAAVVSAAGWALSAVAPTPETALAGLCLAQTGMMSMIITFWALPTAFLSGVAAAGGIAFINSVGNIGGGLAPTILGQFGVWTVAGLLLGGALLTLTIRREEGAVRRD